MVTANRTLQFSPANSKLRKLKKNPALKKYLSRDRKIYSLDLLAGYTCPGAKDCKACVHKDPKTDKLTIIQDPNCPIRCYAATGERRFPASRALHERNTTVLRTMKTPEQFCDLILENLPKNAGVIRYHSSGDFFSLNYLLGAVLASEQRPDVLFYCYTKSINWLKHTDMVSPKLGKIRENFLVTASYGGRFDRQIKKIGVRHITIVYSEEGAIKLGLPLDVDDSHAATACGSFALLIHGTQPPGSEAGKAVYRLLREK